jgi:hypothetical protein
MIPVWYALGVCFELFGWVVFLRYGCYSVNRTVAVAAGGTGTGPTESEMKRCDRLARRGLVCLVVGVAIQLITYVIGS